jgi:membrane-bound metal-dependent hydrolase YbcI (DUF457 family)
MTWKTHVAVGANAVWLTILTGQFDQKILIYLPVAILASLLPDIDASSAKIHYIGHGTLGAFRGLFQGKYFHHRGLMHSLFVTAIFLFILTVIFKDSAYPAIPYIFAASYLSHPLIDGLNYSKVGYFYPFTLRKFSLLPKVLRTQIGGPTDFLLLMLGIIGLLAFFFVYAMNTNQFYRFYF